MELSLFQITLIAGGFTVTGALITALFTFPLARYIAKHNSEIQAKEKFKSILLNEFVGIYPEVVNWPDDIEKQLMESLPRIQSAVYDFKLSIPLKNQQGLDEAWAQYQVHVKEDIPFNCNTANILYSESSTGKFANKHKAKKILAKDIGNLLQYAK